MTVGRHPLRKRFLADRTLGLIIVASVILPILIWYEGDAVSDEDLQPGLASDARALLAVRESFGEDAALNWESDTPIAIWDGVRVAGVPKRVKRLSLKERMLAGTISPRLGDLIELNQLDLRSNQLSGEIPSEVANLVGLTHIYLNNNMLTGTIPNELGSLTGITHLYLHDNMLTGTIPNELGNLSPLTNLWLGNNRLAGEIPPRLENLSNLERLRLSGGNVFTGCIPANLNEVPNNDLSKLDLKTCGGS